mgnify:CR=1 FL=1
MIAMNMKEPQVTKNTLKDLYAVMDNKKAMQKPKMLKMLLNILKLKKKFLGFFLNLGNPLFHFIVKIIVKMKWRNNDEKSSNYNSIRF